MTELEIRENILNLQTQLEAVIANGESEQRELNEEETNQMVALRNSIDEAKAELAKIEEENRKIAKQNNNKTKENRKMEIRLADMVKAIVNNNVTDEQRSYIQGNSIDYRAALQATVTGQGEENVPTYKQPLELAIRNNTILDKLNVRWFENVDGMIDLPKYNGSNVAWAGSENAEAADGAGTFEKVTLSPKRLTAYVDVSRQLINTSPEALEGILIADLGRAIAEKLDKTVFGAGSGSTSEPAGIFDGASAGTLASMTFDDILSLENAVEEKNGTDFVFVTSPNVKYALRGTQTASGLKMVWEDGEIDGRKTVVSNSTVKGGLACFDARDLAVATFNKGGLIITVDTVTRAIYNEVRLVVNYLVDAKLAGDRIATEIFE